MPRRVTISEFKRLSTLFDSWISTKGPKWTIARIKLIRVVVYRYLAGDPLMVIPTELIGLTRKGLPKSLGILNRLIESRNPHAIRLVLTALQLSKLIE